MLNEGLLTAGIKVYLVDNVEIMRKFVKYEISASDLIKVALKEDSIPPESDRSKYYYLGITWLNADSNDENEQNRHCLSAKYAKSKEDAAVVFLANTLRVDLSSI